MGIGHVAVPQSVQPPLEPGGCVGPRPSPEHVAEPPQVGGHASLMGQHAAPEQTEHGGLVLGESHQTQPRVRPAWGALAVAHQVVGPSVPMGETLGVEGA